MEAVDATHWNALHKEFLELKERMDKSPMIRWSVYQMQSYEIQGSQGVYLILKGDKETLDDLCDYIISKEKLLINTCVILKEYVYPDGRRKVVGGSIHDNNGMHLRNSTDPIYNISAIEGYLKQKNKMILRPIQSIDMYCEKYTPDAKADTKRSAVYLFPGDEEEADDDYEKDEDKDEKEGSDSESDGEEEEDMIKYVK